jgi:DNA replication protein DnaC
VWSFCKRMVKAPTDGAKMVLVGNSGAGKTMAARCVYNWLGCARVGMSWMRDNRHHYPSQQWIYWPAFLDALKAGEWNRVNSACEVTLLVLDDIGSEHDPSKLGVDKLCTILEKRARMWTIVTTNILPSEWEARFDRRVASRLARNGRIVDLSQVPDYSTR